MLLVWLAALISVADPQMEGCKADLKIIDQQIETLTKERDLHAKKAAQYQSLGDQWQYRTGKIEYGQENWAKANQERTLMINAQLQINTLQTKKQRIYQLYPQLQNTP